MERVLVVELISLTIGLSGALYFHKLTDENRELSSRIAVLEAKNKEYVDGLLALANGQQVTIELRKDTAIRVQGSIVYEWMAGKYFDKDSGRKPSPNARRLTMLTKRQ